MMVNSGNDAALAIGEYIGAQAGGGLTTFVARMNLKASTLGMNDTTYCQPAGGCFSTPADQVTLWRSVYTDPDFQQFVGPVNYIGCGEDAGGEEVCHTLDKGPGNYPGQDSWKGGSLGFFCPTDDYPETAGLPLCASGGCLTVQATRLQRALLVNVLQPQPLTADRWPDARHLFDHGYRRLFTPDARSTGTDAGESPDFGLDVVTDSLAVSALIDGQTVRLCSWEAYAPTGQLSQLGCAERTVDNLAASATQPRAQEVEVVVSSTLEAEGDFLVGHHDGDALVLRLWRIGPKDF
jgi:D-alanyl-D-alanine carboxypeptidase